MLELLGAGVVCSYRKALGKMLATFRVLFGNTSSRPDDAVLLRLGSRGTSLVSVDLDLFADTSVTVPLRWERGRRPGDPRTLPKYSPRRGGSKEGAEALD